LNNYSLVLDKIISTVTPQLQAISTEDFDFKPDLNKWSKKEIIGHLIDSATNNHKRFLHGATSTDLIFEDYDQDEWVLLNNYQSRTKAELIQLWINSNKHIIRLVTDIPNNILQRATRNHNYGEIAMKNYKQSEPVNLEVLIWDYIYHIEHHLQQILPQYKPQLEAYSNSTVALHQ